MRVNDRGSDDNQSISEKYKKTREKIIKRTGRKIFCWPIANIGCVAPRREKEAASLLKVKSKTCSLFSVNLSSFCGLYSKIHRDFSRTWDEFAVKGGKRFLDAPIAQQSPRLDSWHDATRCPLLGRSYLCIRKIFFNILLKESRANFLLF